MPESPQGRVDWVYAMQMATDHLVAAEAWETSDLAEGIAIGAMHYTAAQSWVTFARAYAEGFETYGRRKVPASDA